MQDALRERLAALDERHESNLRDVEEAREAAVKAVEALEAEEVQRHDDE